MNDKQISDIIEEALRRALALNEDHEEGDLVDDWICVAYVTNPEKEKGGGVAIFLANGVMPEYRAKGLLIQAKQDLDIMYAMEVLKEDGEDD